MRYFLLALLFVFLSFPVFSKEKNNTYLEQDLHSFIKKEYGVNNSNLSVAATDKNVSIFIFQDSLPMLERSIRQFLLSKKGIRDVNVIFTKDKDLYVKPSQDSSKNTEVKTSTNNSDKKEDSFLPKTQIFRALIADPKEPRYSASFLKYDMDTQHGRAFNNLGSVSAGEQMGFFRWNGKGGNVWQWGIDTSIITQFELDAPSLGKANIDFIFGLPLSWRNGDWSSRFRLYHLSSHMGDEYMEREGVDRIEHTYEGVEFLISKDFKNHRAYFGTEYNYAIEPSSIKKHMMQGGYEYYNGDTILLGGYPFVGINFDAYERNEYNLDTSLKAGIEFANKPHQESYFRIMLEAFTGYSPQGQFYTQKADYIGFGFGFGM